MQSKRIMIIGCGGSGKSTLARLLGEKMNFPVVHLDQLYWRANWEHVSNEEFDTLLHHELIKDTWIIDGNFNRTIEERLRYCDTVIYLDFPRITCLIGAIKRVIKNYGKTRPDMGGNCPEKFDLEFLKWIWDFNKKYKNQYEEVLSKVHGKKIFILHNRKECEKLINKLF